MNNKKGFLFTFSFFLLLVGMTLPLFMSLHKKVKAETITDLSNTYWIFNDSLSLPSRAYTYTLNFTSNDVSYTSIYVGDEDEGWMEFNSNQVYTIWNGWSNNVYKTIHITGGNASSNTNLITFLQNNATQYTPVTGTEIIHKYWSPDGVITMSDDSVIGDENIQYDVLFNEFTDSYDNTTQIGLIFKGVQTNQNPSWSYIESINGDGLNIFYHGTTNNINNAMWLQFTPGDYMNTELYDFLSLYGTWFDDENAYLAGMNQGYVEGTVHGRALGQADGVEYTNIVTRIFNGLGNLLSIEVFPHITIALILGLPLLLGIFVIIIKILRG